MIDKFRLDDYVVFRSGVFNVESGTVGQVYDIWDDGSLDVVCVTKNGEDAVHCLPSDVEKYTEKEDEQA